jgi:hypothetical protein
MNDGDHSDYQLRRELHNLEARYDMAKGELSADDAFELWSALWRFSEKVIADHRRLKAAERKHRRTR